MTPLKTIAFVLASFGALVTTSCSGGASSATCVTGRTLECACTSGVKGAQSCTAAGIFSPCSCTGAATAETAPEPDLSCEVVVDHGLEIMRAHFRREFDMELDAADFAEIRVNNVQTCEGEWSVAVRECVLNAASEEALSECLGGTEEAASKSKTTEAREFVKKIYDGARAYYMDPNYARGSITPIPPQFPSLSVGPTPPLDECCSQGGECAPDAAQWDHDTWIALQFSVDDPHYYSYTYATADPFTEFTVRANGDLDCDDIYSTFEMFGIINSMYSDGPAGSAALARINELE